MLLTDHILFLDGEAIIIDKPAGLAVDAPRNGATSLVNHLDSLRFGFKRWPSAVHRLDRDTSGCLLLARNPKAHARFQQAFEAGEVLKHYIAVIEGVPEGNSGVIELPLGKFSTEAEGWRMIVDAKGKAATTQWEKLGVIDSRAILRFIPKTGRTHQIRAHAAYGLRAPIVGDAIYGQKRAHGMLLHSSFLSVPRGDKPPAAATAPLPARFINAGVSLP